LTNDLPHLFCGHPKVDGSSYCEAHHALSRNRVPMRPRILPTPRRVAA
jgi:hypothetical protein